MKRFPSLPGFLLLLCPGLCATIAAQEATETRYSIDLSVYLPPAAEREKSLHTLVEKAIRNDTKNVAWQRLRDKRLARITPQRIALDTLRKNLTIDISRYEADRLQRALMEAQAIFDPVFTFNFSYKDQYSYDRLLPGVRTKTTEERIPQTIPFTSFPQPVREEIARKLGAQIDRIEIGRVTRRTVEVPNLASVKQSIPPITTYDMALTQQLPWGGQASIAVTSNDQDVPYDSRKNTFDAPWFSSLLFNLQLPLPGSRNFGPYSPFNTQVKLAEQQKQRGFWELRSTINTVLRDANLTYLALIQTLENLQIATANRTLLERQVGHIARLFEQSEANNFDRAQIEAELEAARANEAAAQNAFINTSNALAIQIESSTQVVRDTVYLPEGYAPWLGQPLSFPASDKLLAAALNHRPELRVSQVDYQSSEILRRNAIVQTRPDITFNASINAAQNGSVIGYRSYFDSIGNLANPDTLSQSYSLNYTYPWGNVAVKARRVQAEYGVKGSILDLRAVRNNVVNEVNDAWSNLQTAKERVKRTQASLNFSLQAYNSLARRQEIGGDVNVNELLINIRNLLSAKLSYIAAETDLKRAEVSLLAAQGLLPAHYAGITARTAMERQRLSTLAARGDFEYFLP